MMSMQHTPGTSKFNLGSMIQHFIKKKKSKLKIKYLKVPRNQKVFKGLTKETKKYTKMFLKKKKSSEERYKIYEKLFKTLKKKSKKSYNSNMIDKYKSSIKNTQDEKEIIGKSKLEIKKLPYMIVIDQKRKEY